MEHAIIVHKGSVREIIDYYNKQNDKDKHKLNLLLDNTCRRELNHLSCLFSGRPNNCILKCDKEIIEFILQNFEIINEHNRGREINLELIAKRALDEDWSSIFDECVKKAYVFYDDEMNNVLSFFSSVILHCLMMRYYQKVRHLYNNLLNIAKGWNYHLLDYIAKKEDTDALNLLNELDVDLLKDRLALISGSRDDDYIDAAIKYYLQGTDKNVIIDNLKYRIHNESVLRAVKKYDKEIYEILVQDLEDDI